MSTALAHIVDEKKLRETVNSFEFKYGILESIPRIYIGEIESLKKELDGGINPNNFENGRLFSSNSEIRWRKKDKDRFYVLIISDEGQTINGYEKKNLTITREHLSFYLWGEKEPKGTWYELRIPKGWKYPVKNRYGKIKAVEYEVEGKPEEGKFYRFFGFEGEDR